MSRPTAARDDLLSTTEHGIVRIASDVGYESATSLGRALRSWTGSTPSQYRAHAQGS